MKHETQINTEFVKEAGKFEDLSYEGQKEYHRVGTRVDQAKAQVKYEQTIANF